MFIRNLLPFLICCYAFLGNAYADCSAPIASSANTVTHNSASLYWTNPNNSSGSYQLQWRSAGSASWNTEPIVITASTSLTGLTNNTVYEWRVRTICAVGDTSAFTTGTAFQTQCYSISFLNVSSVSYQSASLYWSQIGVNTTYDLRWRPVGTETWTVVSGLGSGYYTLTGLPEDTSIEWQVRTVCAPSIMADYVAGPLFRTLCLPPGNPQATRIFPDAVELKWDRPVADAHFDLQWRVAGSVAWTLVENIAAPEYVLTGLANSTTYEWQVRTACSTTSKSTFSDVRVFQTQCPLPSNVWVSSVSSNGANLQWTSPEANLQWRKTGDVNWTTVADAKSPYSLTGLLNNTSYEWRVQTVCSATATSGYTATQLLTTQCPAPTSTYTYATSTGGLVLSWYSNDGGLFEVQWRVSGTTSWSSVTNLAYSSYTLTGLIPETTYEWRVRKICSATDTSNFLIAQPVKTSCSVPDYLYSQNATGSTIDLGWSQAEAGAHFELQWRPVGATDWTLIPNITTNRYTLTGLQSNVSYEWQVRKICSATSMSLFSISYSFTLNCRQPEYFYSTNINYSSAQLNWYGTSTYVYPPFEVQYRRAGAADWISIAGLTTSQYSLTGLLNNTSYEWRVRSDCPSGGNTSFSAIQTFQTQCGGQLSSELGVQNITYNSAQLVWQNNNKGLYEIQYREVGSQNWIIKQPTGIETDASFGDQSWSTYKQYTLYGLTPGKTYEWRVRTVCSPAIYSDFVNGLSFTVTCLVPTGIYSSQQMNTTLSISWFIPPFATTFDLQWRQANVNAGWNLISGLTGNGYTLTDLTPGNTYEYRLRQVCSPDVVGDFSNTYIASIQCGRPSYAETETISPTSVRLRWTYFGPSSSLGSTFVHDIRYRPSGTQNWTTVSDIVGTSYVLTGLTPTVNYEWQVKTKCSPDYTSDFSYSSTFQPYCSTPYVYGYSTQVGPSSALLTWGSNWNLQQTYKVQWRPAGTTNWQEVSVVSSTYTTVYSLTGLTNHTNYEWRVATDCGSGYQSDFSSIQTFQTACPTVSFLNVNKVGANNVQLSWGGTTPLAGVTYTVQYRKAGTVVWSEQTNVTSTSVTLTGLASKTSYECRVRAACSSDDAAAFSYVSTFLTQCPVPSNFYVNSQTDKTIFVNWLSSTDNVSYNLQWKEDGVSSVWNELLGVTEKSFTLTNLKPGVYYQIRVQTVCSATDLSDFATTSAMTQSPNSFYVISDSVTAQAARLNWSSGPDHTDYVLQWRPKNGNWVSSGVISSKRYWLTGLTNNTTYDVRVSYTDANGNTVENSIAFTTNCPRPGSLYASNIKATSAQLYWWIDRPTPLAIQWRVAGSTTWNTIMNLTSTPYTFILTGLSTNTIYEWRLQSTCDGGSTTETYAATFQTACQMPFTLTTDNVTTTSARLIWNDTGAQYSIRYRKVGTGNWTTLNGLTAGSYVLTGLVNATLYEWAVAATCSPTVSTAFTSPVRFLTQCSAPANLNINAFSSDKVQLTWDGGDASYQLQWQLVGSQNWNTLSAVTSPYTLTGLTAGVTYQWRIRATCAVAADGAFVSGYLFTPQCSAYYYDSPATNNITSNSASLSWSGSPLLTYTLRWRKSGAQNWTELSNITSPYALTGLLNNTSYEWQRKAECESEYGKMQGFQTQCKVPGGLQVDQQMATSARLRWNNSGDGQGYEVRWRMLGTSAWSTISNITSTSCLITGLNSYTQYEWQVRSQCAGTADFPITALFTTSNDCASSLYTIKAGSWDDPTVWSCGRVPTATDSIKLYHTLSVPASYTGHVRTIRYETGGLLTFAVGAIIRLNN